VKFALTFPRERLERSSAALHRRFRRRRNVLKKYVDGHHVHHWAEGGETQLGNLVSLCRFHHRQVHEGGIRIERLDDSAWRFVNAQGESWASSAPGHSQSMAASWTDLSTRHEHDGIPIDPHTARTQRRVESRMAPLQSSHDPGHGKCAAR
jgi:hypothetical protein